MTTSHKEITRRVCKRAKVPQATARRILAALADELTEAMLRGEVVTLWGIGRFRRRCYRGRSATPTGGEAKRLHNGVALSTSERLLKRLREGMEVFDEVEGL